MIRRFLFSLSIAGIIGVFFSSLALGLTITEPKPSTIFHSGDNVTVKLKTAPGENPVAVYCLALHLPFSAISISPPYEFTFTIPSSFTGADTIVAEAKFSDGTIVESKVQIQVVLPSDIVLKSISASPTYILLQKLPAGSDQNEIIAYETDSLAVGGIYSDGVKREITSSSSGTIYTSSDEKVVSVSLEGEVTAQGIGTTTIIVRNGKYSAPVKVVVKPYK
jgi:hypothetical protein